MNYSKIISKGILSAAALIVLAAPASAAKNEWTGIETEINSCVAAVADHANYSDATRVRHTVVDVKERVVGYKLTIETAIFTDSSPTHHWITFAGFSKNASRTCAALKKARAACLFTRLWNWRRRTKICERFCENSCSVCPRHFQSASSPPKNDGRFVPMSTCELQGNC